LLLVVTDNTACSNTASGTQTITVHSLPSVVSVTGGGTYCANATIGNVSAIVTGASPYTIKLYNQWCSQHSFRSN
jgi:hypothetical protein